MAPITTTVSTPWGRADRVAEISVPQRVGERQFEVVVELLETRDGQRLVRFAYATERTVRRGPVTLRARDVPRLWKAIARSPELAETLERG
ncbi:MAG: hypothetical protein U0R50_08145 [Gaiellales bacterium]